MPKEPNYEAIPSSTMRELIRPESQLRVPYEVDNRLSLAGAQGKLSLHNNGDPQSLDTWQRPLDGAPTTYIIKPASPYFEALGVNECLCLRLAKACGIPAVDCWLLGDGDPALVTARYDRQRLGKGYLRLAQEDACQALGIKAADKYEADGGPGIHDIAGLLYEHAANPLQDIERFAKLLIFNLYIGNCDAHGKNYSLLCNQEGHYALAPAYDVASTSYYANLSDKLAMRYGKHKQLSKIDADDMALVADDCGVSAVLMRQWARDVYDSLQESLHAVVQSFDAAEYPVVNALADHIAVESKMRHQQIA
jgi:serine/threonine-protein kinase HipA